MEGKHNGGEYIGTTEGSTDKVSVGKIQWWYQKTKDHLPSPNREGMEHTSTPRN